MRMTILGSRAGDVPEPAFKIKLGSLQARDFTKSLRCDKTEFENLLAAW